MTEQNEQQSADEKFFKYKLGILEKDDSSKFGEYLRRLIATELFEGKTTKFFKADLSLKKTILEGVMTHPEPEWFNENITELKKKREEIQPKPVEPPLPKFTEKEIKSLSDQGPQKDENVLGNEEQIKKEKEKKLMKQISDAWEAARNDKGRPPIGGAQDD